MKKRWAGWFESQNARELFFTSVNAMDLCGCWGWTRARNEHGYGVISVRKKGGGAYRMLKAHRVAYELLIGPIPPGKHLMHICDNPPCVNPLHLRIATHRENMADAVGKQRWPRGEEHWTRRMPERLARGKRHRSQTHPESVARGDQHWTHREPDKARQSIIKMRETHNRRIV